MRVCELLFWICRGNGVEFNLRWARYNSWRVVVTVAASSPPCWGKRAEELTAEGARQAALGSRWVPPKFCWGVPAEFFPARFAWPPWNFGVLLVTDAVERWWNVPHSWSSSDLTAALSEAAATAQAEAHTQPAVLYYCNFRTHCGVVHINGTGHLVQVTFDKKK